MNKAIVLVFENGDTIIGEYVRHSDVLNTITVNKPFRLRYDGAFEFGTPIELAPNDQHYEIKKDRVVRTIENDKVNQIYEGIIDAQRQIKAGILGSSGMMTRFTGRG